MGQIITETTFLSDEFDNLEKTKKDEEYLEYIKDHILNVKRSFVNYMIPLLKKNNISSMISDEDLKAAIIKAAESVQHHDDSKFGDDEFDGYRARWYPTQKEKNGDQEYQDLIRAEYDKAWEHHYTVNGHHPLHWVDPKTKITKDMTLDAIIEIGFDDFSSNIVVLLAEAICMFCKILDFIALLILSLVDRLSKIILVA